MLDQALEWLLQVLDRPLQPGGDGGLALRLRDREPLSKLRQRVLDCPGETMGARPALHDARERLEDVGVGLGGQVVLQEPHTIEVTGDLERQVELAEGGEERRPLGLLERHDRSEERRAGRVGHDLLGRDLLHRERDAHLAP